MKNYFTDTNSPEWEFQKKLTDEFEQKLANSTLSKFEIKIQYYCHIKLYYPHIPKWQYKLLFKLCWNKICDLRNSSSNSII